MFSKVEKNYVNISSKMEYIPKDMDSKNVPLAIQLLELVQLISKKYNLSHVKARFENAESRTVGIVLFNGCHGADVDNIDQENEKPITLLKSLGGRLEKEALAVPYWSNSIITINTSMLENIKWALDLLVTPAEPDEPRMVARCSC